MAAAVERLGLRELIRLPGDLYLEGGDVVLFSRGGRRRGPGSARCGACGTG